jgi:hypothetical protein
VADEPKGYRREDLSGAARWPVLLVGDLAAYFLSTVISFAALGLLGTGGRVPPAITFGCYFLAWLRLSLPLRLYNFAQAKNSRQLWRPFLGAVFAAPAATWLASLLGQPPFSSEIVAAMAGLTAGLVLVWRVLILWRTTGWPRKPTHS